MNEHLHYRLQWQSGAVYPGAHPGQMVGGGQLFKRHVPFIASPDPRRIDLRASVLDPFNGFSVRVYQQQSSIKLYLVADLSASMRFCGESSKQQSLVQLLLDMAYSACNYGDSFGFIGCTDRVKPCWYMPAGQSLERVKALAADISQAYFSGNAHGLIHATPYLPGHRALVFLLSDFHFPLSQLRELLSSLQNHDVVPIVLWDSYECDNWPDWGLVSVQDLESGKDRTLFMRPALRKKIRVAYAQRQMALKECFRAFGCEPLFMTAAYNAALINRYFQQRVA